METNKLDIFKSNAHKAGVELYSHFTNGLFKSIEIFERKLSDYNIQDFTDDRIYKSFISDFKKEVRDEEENSKYTLFISDDFFFNSSFCLFVVKLHNSKLKNIKNDILLQQCTKTYLSTLITDIKLENIDFLDFDYTQSILRNTTNLLFNFVSDALLNEKNQRLFTLINKLSVLTYEKIKNEGVIYFYKPTEIEQINFQFRFSEKKGFSDDNLKLIRKLLELSDAKEKVGLISDSKYLYGIARETNDYPFFKITFGGSNSWELFRNKDSIVRYMNNEPCFLNENLIKNDFERVFKLEFPHANDHISKTYSKAICKLVKENKGAILVISDKAKNFVKNYKDLIISIEPEELNEKNIKKLSSVDGAIIADETGICHGFGAILDGLDTQHGDPARGSRYNSSERFYTYYKAKFEDENEKMNLIVFVLSDDGNYNIFPSSNYNKLIVDYIERHNDATFYDIVENINFMSNLQARMLIRNLLNEGTIKSNGFDKNKKYSLNN